LTGTEDSYYITTFDMVSAKRSHSERGHLIWLSVKTRMEVLYPQTITLWFFLTLNYKLEAHFKVRPPLAVFVRNCYLCSPDGAASGCLTRDFVNIFTRLHPTQRRFSQI